MRENSFDRKNISIEGLLIAIYIALKPVYIWSSGLVQLCDMFLLLGFAYTIIRSRGTIRLNRSSMRYVKLMAFLCFYQFFINAIWSIFLNSNIMRTTLFYVFNLIAVCLFLLLGEQLGKENLNRYIMIGCLCSLLISSGAIVLYAGNQRSTGLFNNPNQLGYYALLMFTFALLCGHELKILSRVIVIVLSVFAVVASCSKAAFIGMIITSILFVVFSGRKTSLKRVVLQTMGITIAGVFVYVLLFSENSLVISNYSVRLMRYRLLNMYRESDTSLGSGRGYNRVKEMNMHFLWGMGEGAYYRFESLKNLEVHSTFVSLLVSYGLIGLIGYIRLFFRAFSDKKRGVINLVMLSGVFFYQMSHNGIRNTLFWLLIVAIYLNNKESKAISHSDDEIQSQ